MATSIPKTTILMAVYNEEIFIKNAIESVLSQACQDFRLIVVDDGSTDQTAEIVQLYLKDPRIKFIKQKNHGQSFALQAGLDFVETPYFLQLDGDDFLHPLAIEILQAEMEKQLSSIAMVYANYLHLEQDTGETKLVVGHPIRTRYELLSYVGAMEPRFYRTNLVRAVGGWQTSDPYNGQFMEDKLLAFKLAGSYGFHWIDRILYTKRKHGKNQTKLAKREYADLKRWAVQNTLNKWNAPYRADFRVLNQWVYTDLVPDNNKKLIHVSVIIPTRNKCKMLKLSLLSFYKQSIESSYFEIIVIDDFSEDDTVKMLEQLNPPFKLKIIRLNYHQYATGARNVGIDKSEGEVIIFSDDDHIVPPNFVQGHWDCHTRDQRKKTVIGIANWTSVFTCWMPGFNAWQEQAISSLFAEQKHLNICLKKARSQPRDTFFINELDILSSSFQQLRYTPKWANEYKQICQHWGNLLEYCSTPWLLSTSRNQSIKKQTLEEVGCFDHRLRRMGCWDLGLRLMKAGIIFEVVPELEGLHQIHARGKDYQDNLFESYEYLRNSHPIVPIYLLSGYIYGWINIYDVAVLSDTYNKFYDSTGSMHRLALEIGNLAYKAATLNENEAVSLKSQFLNLRNQVQQLT